MDLRYQLFHRAASAVLEARRWGADAAVMLVQSFSEAPESWDDFVAFGELLGAPVARQRVVAAAMRSDVTLFLGWVDSDPASDLPAARTLGGA